MEGHSVGSVVGYGVGISDGFSLGSKLVILDNCVGTSLGQIVLGEYEKLA
jgi:hypothetical protein